MGLMKELWENGILQRIIILLVLITFLGISPLPHEVQTRFERKQRTLEFNSLSDSAENLAVIAEALPWRSDLWEKSGYLAFEGGDFQAAISYFKQAASLGELSYEGYLLFGDSYLLSGNYYTAAQIWKADEQLFGPSIEISTRLANIHRTLKDYPALIENLKSLIEFRSSGPELYNELGFLLAAYEPGAAPPYLIRSSELDPKQSGARDLSFAIQRALPYENHTYTLMTSGQKLADLGEWELAALAFRHAIEFQPEFAEAWAFLGEALQHLEPQISESALRTLEKAIELDPLSMPANTLMALYWQRQGDPEQSLVYITVAADIDPQNPSIQVDLGAAFARLGDLEGAASHYLNAIEITSRESFYVNQLVEFYLRYNINIREKALPLARENLLLNPEEPSSIDVLGQVLFRLNDLYSAERFYLSALRIQADYAPAHLHLGILYNFQEKHTLAKQHLSQAIAMDSGTSIADQAQRILDEYANP